MSQQSSDDVNERITDRGDPQETSERHGRDGSESPAPFISRWVPIGSRIGWKCLTIPTNTYREPAAIILIEPNLYYLSYPTETLRHTILALETGEQLAFYSLDTALVALRILFPDIRITHE